ncbi:MAG: strawberry notch family protein [Burkholderiaceae bacterium]|nr:strawberry notch family protein [Burkholderiaceae bacterium]
MQPFKPRHGAPLDTLPGNAPDAGPHNPLRSAREDLLARASATYALVLSGLTPGPDVSASQMREHFTELVLDPERYHEVDEADNPAGLRVGDQVLRDGHGDTPHYVTSIICERLDDTDAILVRTISTTSYGGWCEIWAVRRPGQVASAKDSVASSVSGPPLAPTTDATRKLAAITTATVTSTGHEETLPHAGADAEPSIRAAMKWGFATFKSDDDRYVAPARFPSASTFIDLSEAGCHVTIDIARAPNGAWASAVSASDSKVAFTTELAPTDACIQHPTLNAALQAALRLLKRQLNRHVYELVRDAAEERLSSMTRSSLPIRAPAIVAQAKALARAYIAASGDLFDTSDIQLLGGQAHQSQRAELLRMLNENATIPDKAATMDVLLEAFYDVAGIRQASPQERQQLLAQWLTAPDGAQSLAGDPAKTASMSPDDSAATAANSVSGAAAVTAWVRAQLTAGQRFTNGELFAVAAQAYGSPLTAGTYTSRAIHDAMEAGLHLAIIDARLTPAGAAPDAAANLERIEQILACLPTQTRRTTDSEEFDQYSTVPTLAFIAAWAANLRKDDIMLEPSAGTGANAIHGKMAGATVIVNELAAGRADLLNRHWPQWRQFREDGEQLHNILPADIQPSVIVMNPPFSRTGGRLQGERSNKVIQAHMRQALARLAPCGRLVAIVSENFAPHRPMHRKVWDELLAQSSLRANIKVPGKFYAKYGVSVAVRLIVLDKTGPHTGRTMTMDANALAPIITQLEAIRHDRPFPTSAASPARSPEPRGTGDPAAGNAVQQRSTIGFSAEAGSGTRPADPTGQSGRPGPGADSGMDRPAVANGTGGGGELPEQPGTIAGGRVLPESGHADDGEDTGGRGSDPAGRTGQQPDRAPAPIAGIAVSALQAAASLSTAALSDAVYEQYLPQRLAIPGAQAHPGKLVQSAAMAAVLPPIPTYTPNLPATVVDAARLSLAQLEAIVYAGQAHTRQLPNGERQGFFIGDGTGVGKGREIAGIILDNLRSGRGKAVWVSEKRGLLRDAMRDYQAVGGDGATLFAQAKSRPAAAIDAVGGILFTTYSLLASGQKRKEGKQATLQSRLQQLMQWLGPDFDGVIAFDESHNMANVIEKRGARGAAPPAARALAGLDLQRALPQARIVYVSATGATEVANLAYAPRLGLWGDTTPFASASGFVKAVDAGGVAAMELISRDMKAMGVYIARSLSFDGVTYERLEHALLPLQVDIYNELAGAWQTVLQNVNAALESTGQGKNGHAKSAALSRFWGAHQRFFNQIITAMQMPTVIEHARAALDAGQAVVMQLVNTNEAAQERQLADMAANDTDIEELDFTPRQCLVDYVRSGFPILQYEQYKDEAGLVRSRPATDSSGNPVISRTAEQQRDALLETLHEIRIPDNPIDMVVNSFGPDAVAEVTGRQRRFIQRHDDEGHLQTVEQKRPPSAALADADAFMADRKRILVFSDAGGTGYSFHAAQDAPNQRKRIHYLVQPGWRANKAVQGMGRTHRANEIHQPHYVLPTTNLEAQRRFISSIARRLDQLGALTKGQRQTGSLGLFSADDNLESDYARRALHILFGDMYHHRSPLSFDETVQALGLNGLIDSRTGALNESKLPSMPQFLNRLLSLKTFDQNRVFREFTKTLETVVERARQDGTYDRGMETVNADTVKKMRDELVHTDSRTGAETRYVELALHRPTRFTPFAELPAFASDESGPEAFMGYYRNERSGKVFALLKTGQGVNDKGVTYTRGKQYHPSGPVRYVDNVDQIDAAARGRVTIQRMVPCPVYAGPPFVVEWKRNGQTFQESSNAAANALRSRGLDGMDYMRFMRGIPAERRGAIDKVIARIKENISYEEMERTVRAYTQLAPDEAQRAWAAEIAATPPTHVQPLHLITGALLPVWDRIPDTPKVVRTQTDEGERLLGRVVAPGLLQQTLRNLCVGTDVAQMPTEQVIEQIRAGARGVLSNRWALQATRNAGEQRIELHVPTYTGNDIRWLESLGILHERIRWQSHYFIPTGANEATVLQRLLESKPLADLVLKNDPKEDSPVFSRLPPASVIPSDRPSMALADVMRHAQSVCAAWTPAPPAVCVQSVRDLPFATDNAVRAALHRGKIYLVADHLHDEADIEFVIAHEMIGHYGLRAILGEDGIESEMARLRRANPVLAGRAAQLATAYNIPLADATEEAMADLAASGTEINGFRRLALLLQQGLRHIGLHKAADWLEGKTQAETFELISRARALVTHRRTGMQGAMAFGDPPPSNRPGAMPPDTTARRKPFVTRHDAGQTQYGHSGESSHRI